MGLKVDESTCDAVVVGAGFAGLYMLHRLRDKVGLSVRAFEAGGDVGGTWYWNRYPGARCDTDSYIYCYSFSDELLQEWNWSGKYPAQAEILAYLQHVSRRFDLCRDISFNTRVTSAHFRDSDQRWVVRTSTGECLSARFLVTGVGLLASATFTPDIPGLQSFRGETFHTGSWPHDPVDFTGKAVGVIGTGSTGVQAIPVIAEQAASLHVFQRTPQYTVPARHETVDKAVLDEIKKNYPTIWQNAKWSLGGFPWQHNGKSALDVPPAERTAAYESLWEEGGFKFVFGSFNDILTDRRANDTVSSFIRQKIRERVEDPRLADELIPVGQPFGGRRPIIETNYFETYNKDNVTLVNIRNEPIEAITEQGIRTTDRSIELDIIVFATGFDAVTGPFLRMDIRGRHGIRLEDKWRDGPHTYLGLATSGFPNMFMITGPGSTFGNLPVSIEHHVEWISDCIEYVIANDIDTIEAQSGAEDAWTQEVADRADRTLAPLVDSWWNGANIPGKPRAVLFYLGSFGLYRKRCDAVAERGYDGFSLVSREANSVA